MAPVGFIMMGATSIFSPTKWYFLLYLHGYTWYTIIYLHLGIMNYSSQVWQYMAMAQDGSSRLPMDLQLVGHSHATCPIQGLQPPFRGRENMVPPPNAYLFCRKYLRRIFTWKQKNLVCFITPKSDSSGYSSWFPQAFLCQKPCSAVPAAQNVICPGTHEQINVPCCYNLVHIQITRTRYI